MLDIKSLSASIDGKKILEDLTLKLNLAKYMLLWAQMVRAKAL